MAKESLAPVTLGKAEIAVLDRACAVLADIKRRAANAPRNSDVVREAFNSELREVERVRILVNNLELSL
nr:MAG: hypothetical protein [Microvirus sp.]